MPSESFGQGGRVLISKSRTSKDRLLRNFPLARKAAPRLHLRFMAETPKQIAEQVAKFDQNLDAYHTVAYGETEARVEFINPFFEALGWDVTNKAAIAEAYKDVIHEAAVKVGGATKAPRTTPSE